MVRDHQLGEAIFKSVLPEGVDGKAVPGVSAFDWIKAGLAFNLSASW